MQLGVTAAFTVDLAVVVASVLLAIPAAARVGGQLLSGFLLRHEKSVRIRVGFRSGPVIDVRLDDTDEVERLTEKLSESEKTS